MDDDKLVVFILQSLGGIASIVIVMRAYYAKGYPLSGWQQVGMLFGYILLIMIGDHFLGKFGGFCGMVLFVIIALIRVAALPQPNVQQQFMPQPAPTAPPAPTVPAGIVWNCTACHRPVSAPVVEAGQVVRCPLCNSYQRVPRA